MFGEECRQANDAHAWRYCLKEMQVSLEIIGEVETSLIVRSSFAYEKDDLRV